MGELLLRKIPQGFIPDTELEAQKMQRVKVGNVIRVKWAEPRNYRFHKKFFGMLDFAYECWEPTEQTYKGVVVQKNRERFRKDMIICAGFYDVVPDINGQPRAEAHSISFGSMTQETFEGVYNAVINAVLQRVLTNYTRTDVDMVVEKLMGF